MGVLERAQRALTSILGGSMPGRGLRLGPGPEEMQDAIDRRAASVAGKVATWQSGTPQYSPATTRSVVTKGYLQNPLVQSGLRLILSVFAQADVGIRHRETQKPVLRHPLLDTIRHPQPRRYEYGLWEWTLIDMFLHGSCFWELVRSRTQKVVRIIRMEPERVAIVPGQGREDEDVLGYRYEVDGKWWPVPVQNVLHWRFHHPLDRWFGLSPILAGLRAVDTDNRATDFLNVTLGNLAVPPLAVESQQPISKQDATRFKREWKTMYGEKHRGEIAVLQKGMTIKQIGMNLDELAFPELTALLETRILMCLGGAALVYMVGSRAGMEHATFSNVGEARESLVHETVSPLWDRMDDLLTQALLLPNYEDSDDFEVFFDTSQVPAMQALRLARLKEATAAKTAGVLTRNEARRWAGERPLKVDTIAVPIGSTEMEVTAAGEVKPMPGRETPPTDRADDGDQPQPDDEQDLGEDAPAEEEE